MGCCLGSKVEDASAQFRSQSPEMPIPAGGGPLPRNPSPKKSKGGIAKQEKAEMPDPSINVQINKSKAAFAAKSKEKSIPPTANESSIKRQNTKVKELKDKGDASFKEKKYKNAISSYSNCLVRFRC